MQNKTKHILFVAVTAVAMLLPPLLASFQPGEAMLAIAVLLFMLIDPLAALGLGIAAGWDIRRFWYVPLLTAFLYWLGAVLFLTGWNTDIFAYVFIYLLMGAAAMGVTALIRYLLGKRQP